MGEKLTILLVEDSPQDMEILSARIESSGHEVRPARRLGEARLALAAEPLPDLVISDVHLPDGNGSELIELAGPTRPVILMTAFGEIEEAVAAMRLGAMHYLAKPVRREELEVLIEKAALAIATQNELERLRDIESRTLIESEMVVRAPSMKELMETARAAAATDATVLLLGESGTGKEVVARAVHRLSPRARGPFVAVHCGAIPASLLESDLFGHERGAFTGAVARRIGKFERAQGGTMFLDEIGTMPFELQSRLLRVIQEREAERIGGDRAIRLDFRLIAATNLDLAVAVANGSFREDLFYRLNVVPLRLPPLRDRREEIPALAARFLARRAPGRRIEARAMERMTTYHWPGNIRELENAIERALILAGEDAIAARHLPREIRGERESAEAPAGIMTLEAAKRGAVEAALVAAGGRRDEAARLLGIHRNTLRQLINRFGIDPARAGR
jgi:DNA-binding NtrC family response regulator